MKTEQAIESLKNIIEYWTHKPTEVEAAKLAIEALEKQIPKKPLEQQLNVNKDLIGLCPICKEMWEDIVQIVVKG